MIFKATSISRYFFHRSSAPDNQVAVSKIYQPYLLSRLGGSTQQELPRGPQSQLPSSRSKSRPFPFGSQPQPFLQAGTPQQAQQNLFSPSASHRALVQQPAGQNARHTPAGVSGSSSSALKTDSDTKPQQSRVAANTWTPMKASNDLSRQALVNKLMKGKELPSNSLIAAGLDPTKSTLTPRNVRHPKSESYQLLCRKSAVASTRSSCASACQVRKCLGA